MRPWNNLFCYVSWLLVLLPLWAGAQTSETSFRRFTTEQGLSRDEVTALAHDKRGFLWVGTLNGLNRFDGAQFKVFKRTDRAASLPANHVLTNGITPDPLGYLWIATIRGLCRFDPVREQGLTVPLPQLRDRLADNDFVSPVGFDSAGQGWFASIDRLYRIDPRTLRRTAYSLPYVVANECPLPFPAAGGKVWLISQGAIYLFDPINGRYQYVQGQDLAHPNAPEYFQRLVPGRQQRWYAVAQQGVFRYDATRQRFVGEGARIFNVQTMVETRGSQGQPACWIGTSGRLTYYNPLGRRYTDLVHSPDDVHSYPGGITLALLPDARTGMLWVGTTRGLAVIDPLSNKFKRQFVRSSDPKRYLEDVRVVRQDRRQDSLYWVLTNQPGLMRWERQHQKLTTVVNPLPGYLYDLVQDMQGRVWVGIDGGLGIYDPATSCWQRRPIRLATKTPAVPGEVTVEHLLLDRQQQLWLGSAKHGLLLHDSKRNQTTVYPLPGEAGAACQVHRLQEDGRGRLWVLTSLGLFRLSADRKRVQRVRPQASMATVHQSDRLQSTFLLDRYDNLWLSSLGLVVQADTNGRVRHTYTTANGLRADYTFGLAEDRRGHLWLATDEQLHELNPTTHKFRYYGRSSGLLVNSMYQTFTANRQGELFIGARAGFNYFQPTQLRRNPVPPPVAVTEIRVNNHSRPVGAQVELQPGEQTLTVAFAALNFSQAQKNRYAYRLEGFDPAWTSTDARTVTYTNLAPGNYTLRIRAANNDGVWNLTGQTLAVRVQPAYYQTLWFKALLLAAGTVALWGIYRYRQNQQLQLAAVRDRIAKDLHDDIGSTLSSISIFSEVAQVQLADAHPATVSLLQRISTNASTLAESMQDIIWTIKTNHDGLPDVVTRMREFGLRLTEAKGIRFTMTVAEPFPALRLSVEQRRNLYLIFKESVNNAVKYADCTQLQVKLSVSGRQLHLLIEDDGRGFDLATARTGNGLTNLETRARDICGRITFTTAPGAGTSVALTALLA
ncbi:ligand-binding sensor domain-containing protein [Hymenobacter volaticus]|uniref:Histidine kinase n=1 Tax=Hymenobacter volaticus TaxID=2932254 RepID=A0ABY4GFS9_9BACT|nr:sensor histidine kinase [Hymenobacter volaticus]UOQ69734.1 histidine kinase [Hymenobacter volaticus]